MSNTPTEFAPSEMPVSEAGKAMFGEPSFPPYPPYAVEPAPASVADTIIAGREMRVQHKSMPRQQIRPPPKPARPRGPKATDVKLNRRAARAHARCLRRHNAVLTDRLERMSKPPKRSIIYLWRDYAHLLPADTIARLRSMLDADEPFKPEQAYEYFVNMKKTKKRTKALKVKGIKRNLAAMCEDKRLVWARNATVAFARGIQQRLSRPGRYALADGMLRLSNIILDDVCGIMHVRAPSRRCAHPRAKFMMEMSDKVAVWIDEILSESEDRMLMMDFDEDEDIIRADESGDTGFTDDFLNMMGGAGQLLGPKPAYTNFRGEMLEAFMTLTNSMNKKGDQELFSYGKCSKTYRDGVDELKRAENFSATEFNSMLAKKLNQDLSETAKPDTPPDLEPYMKDMVDICGNYLAQYAEYNKDKGPAFRLLVQHMQKKSNEQLYKKDKAKRTYGTAAKELNEARGLESDHDDPNLSQEIHAALAKTVENVTPPDLKNDMKETLDVCSKYLSEAAVDENERGPAFDLLIQTLMKTGGEPFTPEFPAVATNYAAAYTLKSAPGLSSIVPDLRTEIKFNEQLHRVVDTATPQNMQRDMQDVIDRCANYLSAFVRDRDKAIQGLLQMMKANSKKELTKRENYTMTYGTGAKEVETAPTIVPFMPVKDIADEAKDKLAADMEGQTPPELQIAMKSAIQDVSKHLSQPTAMRSGVAGERYPLSYLSAVKESLGTRPLFKYKSYGQTYKDGAHELKYAGPLETDIKDEALHYAIEAEMSRGVPSQLPASVVTDMSGTINEAVTHLAAVGHDKGKALDHLVHLMKEQGDADLGHLQGYQQTYHDGARRIELAPSLANDKVDKGAYESVRTKLTTLTDNKPSKEHEKHLADIIEDSAKFLAAPVPETEAEKRQVLADLLGRKGKDIIGQQGLYKMTHEDAGTEIMKAPMGVTTSYDEAKRQETLAKIHAVMPDQKVKSMLKVSAEEGSAYITDLVHGRGEAMQLLHDDMKKTGENDFLTIGKFQTSHGNAADLLKSATHFSGYKPVPIILEKVTDKIEAVPAKGGTERAQTHMADTRSLTSHYIAGVATDKSGLDAKSFRALDTSLIKQDEYSNTQEEEERLKREAERRRLEEERRRKIIEAKSVGVGGEDPERELAMSILHKQLRDKGNEVFYQQPHTELTHAQASQWLSMKPPLKVDKTVKESGDTARLHKKFERKLSALVTKNTPSNMHDTMQDVVIESSRTLSEYFVSKNYKALVRDGLISEMQKRGNEILVEVDGPAETFFFAAQRLKKAKSLDVKEPCDHVSYKLIKKLEDMVRCRSMARKLTATMKDHVKEASNYLSELVTKPDEHIEAYVSLLGEMETTGNVLLIEGNIPKSYEDSAAYLRQLTSYEDQIKRPNAALQSSTESRLKNIMANVPLRGYTKSVLDGVIADSTRLLVSYIMLQGEKTGSLKILIEKLDEAGDAVLLRHGNVRKTFTDGAKMLRDKNADQLRVSCADPVVSRKLQIKLYNLMRTTAPHTHTQLMDDVIEDATMYLAVHLLQPKVIQVCKCTQNVFVQCELWCDEILRRVTRPCCSCARHVSAQAIADVCPHVKLRIDTDGLGARGSGVEISLHTCASTAAGASCRAARPTPPCSSNVTTAYMVHTLYHHGLDRSMEQESSSPSFHTPNNSLSSEVRARENISTACDEQVLLQDEARISEECHVGSRKPSPARSGYSSRTPIISTEQMSEWSAMMVSLMWNVQAWRDWIQENIDTTLSYRDDTNYTIAEAEESWSSFQRRVATEALQWRQYNIFSRQLTLRLALRYRDKQIVSPSRGTEQTAAYMQCQQDMLEIIEMFNRWTHWLTAVIKEANSLKLPTDSDIPLHKLRWHHLKEKINEYSEDWLKYNNHLKVCWENKYRTLISEWLGAWKQPGAVWVVSACGAVPSGAVAAGLYRAELIWLARTTHRGSVLPGALHPSKHCCIVYADGAVHHYTKYQVMCNASVSWVAWRAGAETVRAVTVARGVHVGRVLYRGDHLVGTVRPPRYRCHVVIFGRPFAFNCYELLVLNENDD